MEGPHAIIPGLVQNGVVIPIEKNRLPEGADVDTSVAVPLMDPELQAEFDDWERVGDEAWRLIDQWEKEEQQFLFARRC
jgi:hypothetical protein